MAWSWDKNREEWGFRMLREEIRAFGLTRGMEDEDVERKELKELFSCRREE